MIVDADERAGEGEYTPNHPHTQQRGQYNKGAVATLTASANTGFEFSQWSDGVNSATRYVTMDGNKTLTAMFTAVANSGEQNQGSENQGSETEQPDESQNMH